MVSLKEIQAAVAEGVAEALAAHVQSPWLDTTKAAAYLGCEWGTLKTWRARGGGPRFRVINRKLARYHVDDLNAWILGGAS
jgi:hypothetical protein